MLSITAIPAFSDNYIWAIHNETNCYVVDPGDHTVVENFLKRKRLTLSGILITHHHLDHTGGIQALLFNKTIPVYGPHNKRIKGITHGLIEGDEVQLLGCNFTIIATPGHTLDHIAFYANISNQNPILFSGDTLFSGGCGKLFEGTAEQMQRSLDKLASLPDDTQIFCAHEYTQANLTFAITLDPDNVNIKKRIQQVNALRKQGKPSLPSLLTIEKKTNPFLRTRDSQLIRYIRCQNKDINTNPSSVLGAIRIMKDNF